MRHTERATNLDNKAGSLSKSSVTKAAKYLVNISKMMIRESRLRIMESEQKIKLKNKKEE